MVQTLIQSKGSSFSVYYCMALPHTMLPKMDLQDYSKALLELSAMPQSIRLTDLIVGSWPITTSITGSPACGPTFPHLQTAGISGPQASCHGSATCQKSIISAFTFRHLVSRWHNWVVLEQIVAWFPKGTAKWVQWRFLKRGGLGTKSDPVKSISHCSTVYNPNIFLWKCYFRFLFQTEIHFG